MPFDGGVTSLLRRDTVHKQRLLELCRVLDSVSDDAFNLRDWARNGNCDSVACAVGWATRDDWFRKEGFDREGRTPTFGGDRSWRAVRGFFGLSREEAFYLFHAGKYERPTREAVVTRVRELADRR